MANPDSYHVVEFSVAAAATANTVSNAVVCPFAGEIVDARAVGDANLTASTNFTVSQNGVAWTGGNVLAIASGARTSNVLSVTPGVTNGTNYGLYSGKTAQTAGGVGDTSNQPPATTPVATVAAGDVFTVKNSAVPGANVGVVLTIRKA